MDYMYVYDSAVTLFFKMIREIVYLKCFPAKNI